MQNVDFLEFFRTYLLWPKKHSFLSKILKNVSFWLSLLKKNIWEKSRFFEKNHGLTPWQNVHFFDFFRTSLFRLKKHSFLSRISKNASFWFFFGQKKKYEKKFNFWQKPWTNPFAKCRFFSTLWQRLFWGPKSFIFYPENQKMLLSGFFRLKKHIRKRSIFWQKPWTNPFAKCRFFFTLLQFHFSGQKSILYYPEYQNMFFSCFVWSKKTYKKKVEFLPKTMY